MNVINYRIFSLVTALLLLATGGAGWAQCEDGEYVFEINDNDTHGEMTLTLDGSVATAAIDLTQPCDISFDEDGIVDGDSVQIFGDDGFSFLGTCTGDTVSGDLTLGDPCDIDDGRGSTPISLVPARVTQPGGEEDEGEEEEGGGTGEDGDEDGDDDGDGSDNGFGDERSDAANLQPPAQLVDVEFEIGPEIVKAERASIVGVTFTTRLVFSNDNIPDSFWGDPDEDVDPTEDWRFEVQRDDGTWGANNWVRDLKDSANLGYLNWSSPGETDEERNRLARTSPRFLFQFEESNGPLTKEVSVRAVYKDAKDVEHKKTALLRIERQSDETLLAGSSGPSARIVTYSRVLE